MKQIWFFFYRLDRFIYSTKGLLLVIFLITVLFMGFASLSFFSINKLYSENTVLADSLQYTLNRLELVDTNDIYVVYTIDDVGLLKMDTVYDTVVVREILDVDTLIINRYGSKIRSISQRYLTAILTLSYLDTIKLNYEQKKYLLDLMVKNEQDRIQKIKAFKKMK